MAEGINKGVIYGFRHGIISSASICINGSEAEEAIKFAKENPDLDIGLHVTLTQEKPVKSPIEIKSLVNKEGKFYRSIFEFLAKYTLGKIKIQDMKIEIGGQFEKIFNSGLRVTHVDSHQQIHILPGLLEIIIEMCKKYKIHFIRCPYSPIRFNRFLKINRIMQQIFLNFFCLLASKKIKTYNLKTCDLCFDFLYSGNLNEERIKEVIYSLKDGLFEIVCHPAIVDRGLLYNYGHWHYNWESELKAICSLRVREFIKNRSVTIDNFYKLATTG